MFEYKNEILSSRVGNLGASDANLIARVAQTNEIPASAMERLAVAKGLIEPKDKFKTDAMRLGDEVEMTIYEQLKKQDERWESNKLLTSKKYTRDNVGLIAHIDFFLQDDVNKTVKVVECKATSASTMETYENYKNQLWVEYLLAQEYVAQFGRAWKVELTLCHYCTAKHEYEFNPDFVTFKKVRFNGGVFDVARGMDVINGFLSNMTEYYPDDEINSDLLPVAVQEQLTALSNIMLEIKTREQQVEEFKAKLYEFLVAHNVKSIKNEMVTITRVDPTESTSFDYKAFLDDYAKKHPRLCQKLQKEFKKTTKRKGYAKISVK